MAERTPRFMFQNGFTREASTLRSSAELVDHGVEQLRNTALGADWRPPFGWNVVADFNDKLLFNEDSYLRVAQVAAGNYAAGADLATALTTALNAARVYPGWDTSNHRLWLRADWTDIYGDEPASGQQLGVKVDPEGAASAGTGWASQRRIGALGTRPFGYQATLGSRPTYQGARQNGLPCVVFDGTDDALELRYGAGPSGLTLATMFAATTGVHTGFIVLKSDSSGAATQRFLHSTSSAGLTLDWTGGNFRYKVTDGGGAKQVSKAGTQNAFHVVSFGYNGTNVWIGVDDTRSASLATLASGSLTAGLLAEFLTIGGSSTVFHKGDLAEVLLFQNNMSEADRKHVESQLAAKWGITLPYADAWTNTYAATFDVSSGKFTIARTAGAATLLMTSLPNLPYVPGDLDYDSSLADESLQRDIGFSDPNANYAGPSIVGDFPAWQGSAFCEADLGPSSCDVRIIPSVNDGFKWKLGPFSGLATLNGSRDVTIAGLLARVQSQVNTDIFNGSGTSNCSTWSWDVATNKVVVTNNGGSQLTLEVQTGLGQPDALPTLGITATLVMAAGASATAAAELWGWNPTQAVALVGHNTVGFAELATSEFAIRGQGVSTGIASSLKHRNGRNSTTVTVYGTARAMLTTAAAAVGRRFLRLTVHDEGNTDGFVSLPVVFAGPYLEPSRSYAQGYGIARVPFDAAERTEYGALVGEKRPSAYTFRGTFYRVDQDSLDGLLEMFDQVGLVVPFIFAEDPQGGRRAFDWTRYCNFVSTPRATQGVGDGDPADRWEVEVELQENLP